MLEYNKMFTSIIKELSGTTGKMAESSNEIIMSNKSCGAAS